MMKEYKFHINRQFGTEQLSAAAVINSDSTPTEADVKEVLGVLNLAISEQFKSVSEKEISEKLYAAEMLPKRNEAYLAFNKAVDAITPKEDQVEVTVGDTPTVPTEVSEDKIQK